VRRAGIHNLPALTSLCSSLTKADLLVLSSSENLTISTVRALLISPLIWGRKEVGKEVKVYTSILKG